MFLARIRRGSRAFLLTLAFLTVQFLNGPVFLANDALASSAQCSDVFSPSAQNALHESVYESRLNEVRQFFTSQAGRSIDEVIEAALAEDLRARIFQLQALGRTFTNLDPDFFLQQRLDFKLLQGALGDLALARDLRNNADAIQEAELEVHFGLRERKARLNLQSVLATSGWISEPEKTATTYLKQIRALPAGSGDEVRLAERLSQSLRALDQAVAKNKFDSDDIEKGLHELRRKIRWIGLEIQSLRGYLVSESTPLKKKSLSKWFRTLSEANPLMMESKYIRLDAPSVRNPVKIPREMHAVLGQLIIDLGEVKDVSETQILFEQAGREVGFGKKRRTQIREKLESTLGSQAKSHRVYAAEIQKRLQKSALLSAFADELERLN